MEELRTKKALFFLIADKIMQEREAVKEDTHSNQEKQVIKRSPVKIDKSAPTHIQS